MPVSVINIFDDLLVYILRKLGDKQCALCSSILDEPKNVKKLPPEYQICCFCRKTLMTFVKEGLGYVEIIELLDKTRDNIIFSQGKLQRKKVTKKEVICLRLLSRINYETERFKENLKPFFINLN